MGLGISASAVHCRIGHLESEFQALEQAGVQELHFEVSDGTFAPGFGANADWVRVAKGCCGLPCSVHFLTEDPLRHADAFVQAGCNTVFIHPEAGLHHHRVLSYLRDAGVTPGVAVFPATPLIALEYLLASSGAVLLLESEPGSTARRKRSLHERVKIMRENLNYRELRTQLYVETVADAAEAGQLAQAGADLLISNPASWPGPEYGAALRAFRERAATKD